MNKYLLVCDLDGTLLDAKGQVDEASLAKIKAFCIAGGHFVICTGRMDTDIRYVEEKLGFKGEYRISQNGAVIMDKQDHLVSLEVIPEEYVKGLTEVIFRAGLRTEVANQNHRHFPSPRKPEEVAEFVDSSIVIKDLAGYVAAGRMKPTIYLTFGNSEQFATIKAQVNERLGANRVSMVETSPSSLEIFSNKVSKGKAVAWIQEQLHIEKEHLYVAGDAESDTTMFELTEHSYAVQDAPAVIREQAGLYQKTVGDVVEDIYRQEEAQ